MNSELTQQLYRLHEQIQKEQEHYLGYPNAYDFNYENLAPFLNFVINNLGDPFVGNSGIHTCEVEREVIRTFASWVSLEDPWGYVTNGSTESNLKALAQGRNTYPDAVVLCSRDTHYSIAKIAKLLGLKCVAIDSQAQGEISYSHFYQVAKSLKAYPFIICANIGTTMKGAIDRIAMIQSLLTDLKIRDYHLHCDAAQFGGYLPFLDLGEIFDFRNGIDTMSVSGHKFFGSPIPCGIFLSRRGAHLGPHESKVEYIGSFDQTISGSRNGLTPLILWQAFQTHGVEGFRKRAESMMALTQYGLAEIKKLAWPCWANPHSNTIVLQRPSAGLVRKWKLAVEGDIAHIITVPGVSHRLIDLFVRDLMDEKTFAQAI